MFLSECSPKRGELLYHKGKFGGGVRVYWMVQKNFWGGVFRPPSLSLLMFSKKGGILFYLFVCLFIYLFINIQNQNIFSFMTIYKNLF